MAFRYPHQRSHRMCHHRPAGRVFQRERVFFDGVPQAPPPGMAPRTERTRRRTGVAKSFNPQPRWPLRSDPRPIGSKVPVDAQKFIAPAASRQRLQ